MLAFVLAGENAGAVRRAGGGGDKSVEEISAIGGELVDVRGLDDRVTGTSQVVGTVVIGEDDDNIRFVELALRALGR